MTAKGEKAELGKTFEKPREICDPHGANQALLRRVPRAVRATHRSPLLPAMTTIGSAREHSLCIQRHHNTSRVVYDADLWAERRGSRGHHLPKLHHRR